MNAQKIAEAIKDQHIGHVLIHYAGSVAMFIEFDKHGEIKKLKTGATGVFNRILDAIDDPEFKQMMIEQVKDAKRVWLEGA